MYKRVLPLLLAGVLVLSACAAGTGSSSATQSPDETAFSGPDEDLLDVVELDEPEEPQEPDPEPMEMTLEEAEALLVEDASGAVPISSPEQLVALAVLVNSGDTTHYGKTYQMQGELRMPDIALVPIGGGENEEDMPRFGGIFDGGNNLLYNVNVPRSTANKVGTGLFGALAQGGEVRNLHLTGAQVTGYDATGGVVGYNGGSMNNCSYRGDVTSTGAGVGGLCGLVAPGAVVEGCFSNTDTAGAQRAGAFIGATAQGSVVKNCYALGTVTAIAPGSGDGASQIGGFIGRQDGGNVENCYANTEVYTRVSAQVVGAFIGYNNGSPQGCYYNKTATENWQDVDANYDDLAYDITGCTVEELLDEDTYQGWDFAGTWATLEGRNRGLPYLQAAWD